jgi:nitrous-oxide reductase
VVSALLVSLSGCGTGEKSTVAPPIAGLPAEANRLIKERGLAPEDVTAALTTYMPTGKMDDYVMFASGGQAGQVLAVGLPSMRVLRTIAVFTPEPWQGYGYGVKETALPNQDTPGGVGRGPLSWGDTHHPALSETGGEYDGQFLFINDKANSRLAVIDLRDLETKQIVSNPVFNNNHGSTMVTPNTDYVVEGSQYATPLGHKYAPISKYKEEYRGLMTFWKFDRKAGRIDPKSSFAVELPPYMQDLADAGKTRKKPSPPASPPTSTASA